MVAFSSCFSFCLLLITLAFVPLSMALQSGWSGSSSVMEVRALESATKPVPVVLWHGMGDSCCHPWSMGAIKRLLEEHIGNDVYILSLRIGDNELQDTRNSFFMNVNDQVQYVCNVIANDPKLANGYHAIGFSQGAQFLRAVAQRCPQGMRVLVSMGGQHQGIFGFPECLAENHLICRLVRRMLDVGAYTKWVQSFLAQAEYWHDPKEEEEYRRVSVFLADINNERTKKNEKYKQNLMRLHKFVMVKFDNDTVVEPRESEWFGYYAPGSTERMLSLRESRLYREDWLGLRQMDEEGKLVFLATEGQHLRFSDDFFVNKIIKQYLV